MPGDFGAVPWREFSSGSPRPPRNSDPPGRGGDIVTATSPASVLAAAESQELDAVLAWLLRAAGALCPVPRSGRWRAYCYEV